MRSRSMEEECFGSEVERQKHVSEVFSSSFCLVLAAMLAPKHCSRVRMSKKRGEKCVRLERRSEEGKSE